MSRVSRVIATLLAAITAGALVFAAAPAAAAGVDTAIVIETSGPIEIAFGEEWLIVLTVEVQYEGGPNLPLGPNDGTVDVYLSGIGGAYASGLAIQPDGRVYFSQPSTTPLLAAGSYDVSAIYNPAPGGYYASSQTATSLALTVTPLEVTPNVTVGVDPSVSEHPVITASIAGSYVEAAGGAPAGTWDFAVEGPSGDSVFDAQLAQPQGGTEPVRVEITSKLEKGQRYTVNATFTPVDELAGGITAATIEPVDFQTPAGGFGDAIVAPVPMPLWLALVLLALVLGLATVAIVLAVKARGRTASPAQGVARDASGEQRIPGDPSNVEVVSLEEMGLPDPATIPELSDESEPTRKLPTSTTWLLSDVEPATSLPNPADAPTERIDAVISPDDAATELIETGETATKGEKTES